jgi:transcriptional regulator with XRE-family HTH domain
MNFKLYWRSLSPEGKKALAERVHTSIPYLSQIAHGHRIPSKRFFELIAIAIQENADGK